MPEEFLLNGKPIDLQTYDPPTEGDYRRLETFRSHAYGGRGGQSADNLLKTTPRKGKFTSFPVAGIRVK